MVEVGVSLRVWFMATLEILTDQQLQQVFQSAFIQSLMNLTINRSNSSANEGATVWLSSNSKGVTDIASILAIS
jgi:hypothetical protein